MRNRSVLLLFLFGLVSSQAAAVQCTAHSATRRTHLVELYTSEGCSSCPPADRWLRTIEASDKVIPLEFHVDYWDSLGWPDPYADHRFSQRQRQLAARSARPVSYTPEVALDGHEWRAWPRSPIPTANEKAPVRLVLHVQDDSTLRASLQVIADTGFAGSADRVYFALTEDGLVSHVDAGENRGAVLRHSHTVRAFAGPLTLRTAHADLTLPKDLQRSRSAVVAFVQDKTTGNIVQSVRQSLAACPGTDSP
ncbi:MAG: DUF1223 domain-containing protein [Rhodanobacteraceae bacterium]